MANDELKIVIKTDAGPSAQVIKSVGESLLGAGKAAGSTDEQLKALHAALQAAADAATKAKSPMEELKDAVNALAEAQKNNAKASEIDAAQKRVSAAASRVQAEEDKKLLEEEKRLEQQKQRLNQAIHNLASGMSGSVGQFLSFIENLKGAAKEGSKTEVALLAVSGVLNGLSSIYSRVNQAIRANAEEGQKASQAIVGAQNHLESSVDDLATAFTDGLAPAIAGITQVLVPVIEHLADWVKEGDNAKDISLVMIAAFQGLSAVMTGLSIAIARVNYSYVKYKDLLGQTVKGELDNAQKSYEDTSKFWDQTNTNLMILVDKIKDGGAGLGSILDDEIALGKKGAQLIGDLNAKINEDVSASHAERLEIIQAFQRQYAEAIGEAPAVERKIDKMIAAEKKAAARESAQTAKEAATSRAKAAKDGQEAEEKQFKEFMERKKTELQSAMDLELSAAGDNADKKLEIMARYQEEYNTLYFDALDKRTEFQVKMDELEKKSHEDWLKRKEEQAKTEAEMEKARNEAIQASVEERISFIEVEGKSEAEVSKKKIALYQQVMKAAGVSAEYRKKVEIQLLQEQKKINLDSAKSIEDYSKKASSIISGMVTKLIFEHKSLKEVVGETMKQLAQEVITKLTEMAATAIVKAILTSGAIKGTTSAETSAYTQTMAAAVTSWAGAIPIAGPGIAAALIASYKAMIAGAGALKFESGGSVAGRVAGLGAQDTQPFQAYANSKEGVLSETGMKAVGGDAGLDRLNRGESSGAGAQAGAGGRVVVEVIHRFEGIPASIEAMLAPWMAPLAKALRQAVLYKGVLLTATDLKTGRNIA